MADVSGTEVQGDRVTRELRLPGLRLTVLEGPDAGRSVAVTAACVGVGTAPDNAIVLTDPGVSRHHFELRTEVSGVIVRDLGSTNGTFVDGLRVREVFLSPGSLIRAGDSALRAVTVDEVMAVPLSAREHFGRLTGRSHEMRYVFAVLERVSPTNVTVLIEGETGTGKELAAEAIHMRSTRASMPFIPVDCGAIAENLVESELFGHVRGAFTGAIGDRKGAFEEANGGTLFLDEVGELPLELQPKLLRALEMREIRRVGTSRSVKVDVRLLAATNRDLAAEVNRGAFREDLFYRLAVVRVRLPPLRTRREDIAVLVRSFFRLLSPSSPMPSDEMLAALAARDWPGNVRELRNAVERALAMTRPAGPVSLVKDAGEAASIRAAAAPLLGLPLKEATDKWVDIFRHMYVTHLLNTTGSVTAAARAAAMSRRQLQRIMASLGIRDESASAIDGSEDEPAESD